LASIFCAFLDLVEEISISVPPTLYRSKFEENPLQRPCGRGDQRNGIEETASKTRKAPGGEEGKNPRDFLSSVHERRKSV